MDQLKTGRFLKALRKEKGFTQEQLAEKLGVSSRSVSRWETGNSMPDFDLLIELAKTYEVGIEEILNGEKREMDAHTEKALYEAAAYTAAEKERLIRRLHGCALAGMLAQIAFIVLYAAGLTEHSAGEKAASFACGLALGMTVVAVLYTSKYIVRLQRFKQRMLCRSKDSTHEA